MFAMKPALSFETSNSSVYSNDYYDDYSNDYDDEQFLLIEDDIEYFDDAPPKNKSKSVGNSDFFFTAEQLQDYVEQLNKKNDEMMKEKEKEMKKEIKSKKTYDLLSRNIPKDLKDNATMAVVLLMCHAFFFF